MNVEAVIGAGAIRAVAQIGLQVEQIVGQVVFKLRYWQQTALACAGMGVG
jgi:hypothetical protein